MMPCVRGEAPPLLLKHGDQIGLDYAAKRKENPSYKFNWPRREGQGLDELVREALGCMTDYHCAYCDGYPLGATGEAQMDHFRPKGRPEFYHLVAEWTNLFLACMACNKAKLEDWDEALLRPDELGYSFERYFEYRSDTGKLGPNSASGTDDQHRARRTIEILGLNRAGACMSRRRAIDRIRKAHGLDDLQDQDYRFLIPLVIGSGSGPDIAI